MENFTTKLTILALSISYVTCDIPNLYRKKVQGFHAIAPPQGLPVARHQTHHQQSTNAVGPDIAIVRQESDASPEGEYRFVYETANGISAHEQASVKAVGENEITKSAQGSFAYTAPNGEPIQLSYVADENGYHPEGAHLPVAPPTPHAILRALEYIKTHPYKELPDPHAPPTRRF